MGTEALKMSLKAGTLAWGHGLASLLLAALAFLEDHVGNGLFTLSSFRAIDQSRNNSKLCLSVCLCLHLHLCVHGWWVVRAQRACVACVRDSEGGRAGGWGVLGPLLNVRVVVQTR